MNLLCEKLLCGTIVCENLVSANVIILCSGDWRMYITVHVSDSGKYNYQYTLYNLTIYIYKLD